MFVSDSNKIGDKFVLKRDIEMFGGKLLKGSVMTIIGNGPRGYDFKDENGKKLLETGLLDFEKTFRKL